MGDKIRADLHFHGTIGLQDIWLKRQGYYGRNLSKLIVDISLERGIGLVNLISEDFEISKGDLNVDRFYHMINGLNRLGEDYNYDKLGETALIVEKRNKGRVIFTNGQCVIVEEEGRKDHLVVGSNQIPNKKSLKETIDYCKDHGLIQISEHPTCLEHFGIGEELLEKYCEDYDAIEGFNAQMILPHFLKFLPVIGIANWEVNKRSENLALRYSKPCISSSDAHNLSNGNGFGQSYIEFNENNLDLSNEEDFLSSLRDIIRNKKFNSIKKYSNFLPWFKWCSDFMIVHKCFPNEDLCS